MVGVIRMKQDCPLWNDVPTVQILHLIIISLISILTTLTSDIIHLIDLEQMLKKYYGGGKSRFHPHMVVKVFAYE